MGVEVAETAAAPLDAEVLLPLLPNPRPRASRRVKDDDEGCGGTGAAPLGPAPVELAGEAAPDGVVPAALVPLLPPPRVCEKAAASSIADAAAVAAVAACAAAFVTAPWACSTATTHSTATSGTRDGMTAQRAPSAAAARSRSVSDCCDKQTSAGVTSDMTTASNAGVPRV